MFRVVAWYGTASWLAIQVADTTFTRFGLPEWTVRAVILLFLAGLPVAVVLAWAFDVTPDGMRRTEPPPGDGAARPEGSPLRSVSLWAAVAVAVLVTFAAVQAWRTFGAEASSAGGRPKGRPTIAVLPFTSLNPDADSVGLTGGLHDVLITQLARLGGLQVRSRTSVMKYQGWTGGLRAIGDELGVALVVEGTVQRVGKRLVVNAQLIDVKSDTHLWAGTLDRTSEDLFALQSEIARQVVEALRVTISPDERRSLATAPTADTLAYAMYLQARQLRAQAFQAGSFPDEKLLLEAIARVQEAIARDPGFALGLATLAGLHADVAWTTTTSDYRFHAEAARKAAERAIAAGPDLPEAALARGVVRFQIDLDARGAVEHLERAVAGLPNDAYARDRLGSALILKGRWEEALARKREAAELEPGSGAFQLSIALICVALRDPVCARDASARAALVDPRAFEEATAPARTEVRLTGDLEPFRRWLAGPGASFPAHPDLTSLRSWVLLADGDLRGALDAVERAPAEGRLRHGFWRAELLRILGRAGEARVIYEEDRRRHEAELAAPRDEWVEAMARARLARVLARLGDRDGALAQAQRAEGLYGYARDPGDGSPIAAFCAEAHLLAGDREAAIDRLEPMVKGRSWISAGELWTDPSFAELHGEPRFRALIASQGIDVSKEPLASVRAAAAR